MQYVHPMVPAELLRDEADEAPVPRPALAGGSDRRPPGNGQPPAQVIRFPVERVRRGDTPEDSSGDIDSRRKAPAQERSGLDATTADSLWPAWMRRTLSGRYRAPPTAEASQTGLTV